MYKVKVAIEGIAPILFNRFTDEAKEAMDVGRTGGKRTPTQKMDEAKAKAYVGKEGVYIPSVNIKRCLLQGAQKSGLKFGKKGLSQFLEALVFIEEPEVLFNKKECDFIDERVGRIPPKTGPAAIIRRPGIHTGWKLAFTLMVADDRIDSVQIKAAMQEAGLLQGIGSFRPEFGRFVVAGWDVVQATPSKSKAA